MKRYEKKMKNLLIASKQMLCNFLFFLNQKKSNQEIFSAVYKKNMWGGGEENFIQERDQMIFLQ